jgi:selenocysteine lyase/cysteine desulfurase
MDNQKKLFQLDQGVHYLNCAYMSPLLKSVEEAGIKGMQGKRNPFTIKTNDFFETAEITKKNIGLLINANPENIALIPSASYGLASAVTNLPLNNGTKAIVIENEFPSGYDTIKKWCDNHNKTFTIVAEPISNAKGRDWNANIIEAIDKNTAVVMLSSVHWMDGTKFNLEAIGQKCHENDVVFMVDGTQSVGAARIDIKSYYIDVLVCAAYKWLLGPYSIGFGYYSDRFASGIPLEEAWVNRTNAEDFTKLTQYSQDYKTGSHRYNVGEFGNFILLPMFNAAVEQLLKWGVENIEDYCQKISEPLIAFLEKSNYTIEKKQYRSKHLFGVSLPVSINLNDLLTALENNKIYVSVRGKSIRVSIHLFTTSEDINALQAVLEQYNINS